MAVPKRKLSKQRGNTRYATWKTAAPTLIECSHCKALIQSHRVCNECGYYDGEKKIEVASDKKK